MIGCFLFSVYSLVIYVLSFNDLVYIFNNTFVEVLIAYLYKFLRKFFIWEAQGTLITRNKYDILIVIGLLLNNIVHIVIHVGPDENINPAIFGSLWVFLCLEEVFSNTYMAQLLNSFNFLLAQLSFLAAQLSSKGIIQPIQRLNIGIIVMYMLTVQNVDNLLRKVFRRLLMVVRLKKLLVTGESF